MKTILLISLVLTFISATVVPREGPIVTHVPLNYTVNLEDPPEIRWEKIVKDYIEPLKKFIQYVDTLPIPPSFY
jgi:hypothetical protein